ncbi:MAG: hypothetical protein F9K49_01480 [Caedimonadaceae bacterium]|nr:MAG: hypothetical protein F9K49_01480 [Caedimonadaceae bacterium]
MHYKEQAMGDNKQADFPVQYGCFIAIEYLRCTTLLREKVRILIGRFPKLEYFKEDDLQQQRSGKERIRYIFTLKQTSNNQCGNNRNNPGRCSQKETPVRSSTIRLIFSKKCSHGFPVLSAVSITFLKSIQKLSSLKSFEFPCLSLQQHGAFLLSKEAKPFAFLSFFESITNLTHRICAKP